MRTQANVNPSVDHPRWSQASERALIDSSGWSAQRIPTSLYNGYEAQVSYLYPQSLQASEDLYK